MNLFQNRHHKTNTGRPESLPKQRSMKNRRKDCGLLAYYVAGGVEHRANAERRKTQHSAQAEEHPPENRKSCDRRKVINTKYLNCGKVIDQRDSHRRSQDRVDPSAVAQERLKRLGPGWLD